MSSPESINDCKWLNRFLSTPIIWPKIGLHYTKLSVFFFRVFSPYESLVANALWFNSHLGVGLYIYNRPHLLSAPKYERVMYSVYGAAIFNFGVVLFWATCKTLLPRSIPVRVLFGLGSGAAVFIIGKNYLDFVDKQAVTMETEE